MHSVAVVAVVAAGETQWPTTTAMGHWHRAALTAQGLVEYAIILLFIAIVVVGTLGILGSSLADFYQAAAGAFPGS